MKIRVTYSASKVTAQGEDFVEIECDNYQSPKLPVFVLTYTDDQPDKATRGYYLEVSDRGALKAVKTA